MMATARLRYLRIAPRKVRLTADLIRGKSVEEAQAALSFLVKKSARPLLKLLNSAAASAKNNFQQDPANLFISKITVDEGPKFKRWRARARGQVSEIQKKTSHITLVLEEMVNKPKRAKRIKKVEEVKKAKTPIVSTQEKISKEKPKFRPRAEMPRPKTEKGIKRIFRRKAF